MQSFLVAIIALMICLAGRSQTSGSTAAQPDTLHSVRKAVIFSAVLPGSGQIYNHIAMPKGQKKAYWKVPLIYAGLGATGYYMYRNNVLKNELRQEYESRTAGNPPSAKYAQYDQEGVGALFKTARSRRDLCILGFGFVYILNVVDAGVEAHFISFDISDDLSLSFHPVLMPNFTPGFGARLNFR